MFEESKKQYVDLTPSWSGILPLLLELYSNGGDSGDMAYEEMQKMARVADAHVALNKENKE